MSLFITNTHEQHYGMTTEDTSVKHYYHWNNLWRTYVTTDMAGWRISRNTLVTFHCIRLDDIHSIFRTMISDRRFLNQQSPSLQGEGRLRTPWSREPYAKCRKTFPSDGRLPYLNFIIPEGATGQIEAECQERGLEWRKSRKQGYVTNIVINFADPQSQDQTVTAGPSMRQTTTTVANMVTAPGLYSQYTPNRR